MNWKYVKPLSSEKLLKAFETAQDFKFPVEYQSCVIQHNGGRPEKKAFFNSTGNERVVKSFLSFNPDDKENIWDVAKWSGSEISEQYLPFAMDNFGNLICFQKDNATIVFINMENKSIEDVANSFAEFMKKLEESG